MKKIAILHLFAAFFAIAPLGTIAATYSTDATMSLQRGDGIYNVAVRVSELREQDGTVTERVIAEPRVQSGLGVPATLYSGLQPSHPNYGSAENVTVDVAWPYPNESGTASCTVTIRRGDQIVSRSALKLKIQGPGRAPLILSTQDVIAKSVQVGNKELECYVLLEFAHRSKEEVKELAIENYGNRVQIQDSKGRLTEGGRSFGSYHQIGMALDCGSVEKAERVASLLRGGDSN